MKGRKLFLFSGIGDHAGFVAQMQWNGLNVAGDMRFPDHHQYTASDISDIRKRASLSGADALLTTEKDAVRLSGEEGLVGELMQELSLFYACIAVDVTDGQWILDSMLDKCLAREAS
jgi:tetraacyldisaccharide-1-P 4'-kinase